MKWNTFQLLASMLVTMLLGLKLTVRPDLSWWVVTAPLWIPFVTGAVSSMLIGAVKGYRQRRESELRLRAKLDGGKGGEKV